MIIPGPQLHHHLNPSSSSSSTGTDNSSYNNDDYDDDNQNHDFYNNDITTRRLRRHRVTDGGSGGDDNKNANNDNNMTDESSSFNGRNQQTMTTTSSGTSTSSSLPCSPAWLSSSSSSQKQYPKTTTRPSSSTIETFDVTITFVLGFLSAVLLLLPFTDGHSLLLPPSTSLIVFMMVAIIMSAIAARRSFPSHRRSDSGSTLPSLVISSISSDAINNSPTPYRSNPPSSSSSSLSHLLASIHAPPLPTIPSLPPHPLLLSLTSSHTSLLSLMDTYISTLYIGTSLSLHLGPAGRGVSRVERAALERRRSSSSSRRREPGGLGKEKRCLFDVMRRQVKLLRVILGEVEEEEWEDDVMEGEMMVVVGLTVLMATRRRLGELLSRSLAHLLLRPMKDDDEVVTTTRMRIQKCIDGAVDGSLYLTALCQWNDFDETTTKTTTSVGGGCSPSCDDELRRFGEELDGARVSLGAFRRRRYQEDGEEDEVMRWWTTLGDRLTEMRNLYHSIDEILQMESSSSATETEDATDDGNGHGDSENMTASAVARDTLEFTCGGRQNHSSPHSSPDASDDRNATTTIVFAGRGIITPDDDNNNQRKNNRKRQQDTSLSINNNERELLHQRPAIDRSSLLRELQRRLDHLTVIETEKIVDVDDLSSSRAPSTVGDGDDAAVTEPMMESKEETTSSSVWLGASGSLLSELKQVLLLPEDSSRVVVVGDDVD